MAATGTLTLTQNSTTVTGSGTAFTTALAVGGFIVATVGGTGYTLGIKSIESNTSLTLNTAYNGPTASGVVFDYVPLATLNLITSALAAQVTYALRAANLDRNNWQQIFSGTGNVNVTLPDGTQYSGPSWNSLSKSLAGLGNAATRNVGTVAGTVAAGDDSRLNTIHGKSGGTISSAVTVNKLSADGSNTVGDGLNIVAADPNFNIVMQYYLVTGQYHKFRMVQNGTETLQVRSSGAVYASSFNPTSDSRLKFNKKFIEGALTKTLSLRGMTYDLQGERRAGVIAQDAEKFLPEAVNNNATQVVLEDGTVLDSTKSLDYSGVTALHTEAIKDVVALMLLCLEDPEKAKVTLMQLNDAINTSKDDENNTELKMEWALLNPSIEPSEPAE